MIYILVVTLTVLVSVVIQGHRILVTFKLAVAIRIEGIHVDLIPGNDFRRGRVSLLLSIVELIPA